ncbi:hypothetical protein ACFL59_11260 [Planctomycetota bacterium]
MAQVQKSTVSIQFQPPLRTEEGLQAMEGFCNETMRLINSMLKEKAQDPRELESSVRYGWFQLPEEPGLYAVQVIGPHEHEDVCDIGGLLQDEANERGYDIEIHVVAQ